MDGSETDYLLRRAHDEALAASSAAHPAAAAAHDLLARFYSARAILELGEADDAAESGSARRKREQADGRG